jgi:vacuolar-type H+-ATPase subunit I/STV1
MARSLEELKTLFEEKGIADAYQDAFALIEAEKNRGIAAKREVNREAEGLRKRAKAFESIAKMAGHETIDDMDNVLESLSGKIKGADEVVKSKEKLTETEKTLQAIMKKLEAADKEKETLAKQSKDNALRSALTTAFGDRAIGVPLVVDSLISKGAVDIEGNSVIFKSGEDVLDLQGGVNKFLTDFPEFAKSRQSGGGGSTSGGQNKTKTLDRAAYFAMAPKEQVAFTKSGGAVTD